MRFGVERPKAPSSSPAALGKRPQTCTIATLAERFPEIFANAELRPPAGTVLAAASSTNTTQDSISGTCLVCCKETDLYRAVAPDRIVRTDRVLEIGSDLGLLCAIASPLCGGALVGVDLSELSVAKARASYPHIRFEQLDVLAQGAAASLRELGGGDGFSVCFVDINGNRPLPAVLSVLDLVLTELRPRPRLVCVKSRELWRALGASGTRARTGGGAV